MRRILSLLIVLVLCLGLAVPAFAAEDGFVPSITYKPNPEVVEVPGEDDEPYIGLIRDDQGEIIDYVNAYRRLEYSVDGSVIYNPSAIDVTIQTAWTSVTLPAGQYTHIEETPL